MWNIFEVHEPVRHLETFQENIGKSAYPPIFFKLTPEEKFGKSAYSTIFFKLTPEVPYGERISTTKYFRGTRTRSASRDISRKNSGKARNHRFSLNSHQRYHMLRGSHLRNIFEVHAPVRHLETFEEKFGKSAYLPIFYKLTPEVPYGERISHVKYFRGTRTRSAPRDIWRKIQEKRVPTDFL